MFARKLRVTLKGPEGERLCPIKYLDSFAMRNFTGESRFDDTLPTGDGSLEAGRRVVLAELRDGLESWFKRKSYLRENEHVELAEASSPPEPRHAV